MSVSFNALSTIKAPASPAASRATNKTWSTEKIEALLRDIEDGVADIPVGGPFFEKNTEWRAPGLTYMYTPEELEEYARCRQSVVYFAQNYCYVMQDAGYQLIKLRPYQVKILQAFQTHRLNILMASRQIGKSVCAGIFIAWYICFHREKNVMVLANKGSTATEILDKIKEVITHLPFFLKPGILRNNDGSMRFDNKCRVMTQATSKKAAIGFTIHLLFADEFAHIHRNFLKPFWNSIYPTLSSSNISRAIITSTPHGMNLFHSLFTGASNMGGKNPFHATRVDYWEVPGRDEAWKEKEISVMGEDGFNQEYGLQFIADTNMLLPPSALTFLGKVKKDFVWVELEALEDAEIDYSGLKWHPDRASMEFEEDDRFVVSVDIADGEGGNFSVANIFLLQPQSPASIRKKVVFDSEADFFGLRQIGVFRSNSMPTDIFARLVQVLVFEVLGGEVTKVIVEMNHDGRYFLEKFSNHPDFFEEVLFYTKHTIDAKVLKPGLKTGANKGSMCMDFRRNVMERRVIIEEAVTVEETTTFGRNPNGTYSAQVGNDDVVMTCVFLSEYLKSEDFVSAVEEVYDYIDERYADEIQRKINEGGADDDSFSDSSDFLDSLL